VVNPDVAIILEVDIAGDVPGIKPEEASAKLGQGPSIMLLDARMIPNLQFRDFVMDTAAELGINLQLSVMTGGATDGGMIHLHGTGVPTVVLGVATRHIHSHNSIIHRRDYDDARQLLLALLQRLDVDTVSGFTAD
jgi:endoglucanase